MKRIPTRLSVLVAAMLFLLSPAARADGSGVALTLTQDGAVTAGNSVDFDASFVNDGASTVFINGDDFSAGFPVSLDDTNFVFFFVFGIGPVSLAPGQALSGVDVFTVTIDPSALPGSYAGNFGVTGGADPFASDALALSTFNVAVTGSTSNSMPEPAEFLLLLSGLAALAVAHRLSVHSIRRSV